ncbi:Atg14p Ecym_3438 [Eremothecium cymbalariae DBVPG|uniref:Autophagy-related protein 14 n=1 Tax=Eremothecium cymbalariae (strain CBS 270.75 / DBVPG 7215 / KCTC 17166 / NRRL Y-17582) TaxID=931890 RepID=G8JS04_ERECY|nr:Hypothetical protein Ecym_3438 [Eremothecium cymbalariae DBVPG\
MQCSLCHRPSTVWYCAHCVNTSPKLILKYKLELLEIHEDLSKMRDAVTSTLENAIGRREGILGKHMDRLQQLQLKRVNAKILYRINEMDRYLESKRRRRDELRAMLETIPSSAPPAASSHITEYKELQRKHRQLQTIVSANSSLKFQELCQWFIVTKRQDTRDSFKYPYSIRFIPMCNIRNWYLLSTSREALQHMWEFVILASQVLLVDIPYSFVYTENPEDPWITISQLIINLVMILSRFKLVQEPPDLADILYRHDIDGMIYHLCTNEEMECKKGTELPSFKMVYEFVQDLQEDSDQSADNGNWMVLK